ncbi:hypothetical protein [Sphingomonas sp. 28-63-12]|uniref:hypothetical protein n=1 Tax=Sphingomonas sp. 28-63-12 TaxID=1970434 RepID=UPI000BCD303B|nr:MAG: hypothetical protein B7Y47_14800 [Sphingomonas sp. 28-63-12]
MSPFQDMKLWLVGLTGLAKDALHIYVALSLFFGSALLFKWPLTSWRPWLVVLAAALLGEAWDIADLRVISVPLDLGGNWHDIWNTLFWPSMILLLARTTRLFVRSGADGFEQPRE